MKHGLMQQVAEEISGSADKLIPSAEICFAKAVLPNSVGRAFQWEGRQFWGFYSEATSQVKEFFAGGCAEKLMSLRWLASSHVSDCRLEGFELLVEQNPAPYATYPQEWSFDMLKDAALAALEINRVANEHGWTWNGCHPRNFHFVNNRPLCFDIRGFAPARSKPLGDVSRDFLSAFLNPLIIWASGDPFLARRILAEGRCVMPELSWGLYSNSALRWAGARYADNLASKRARIFECAAKQMRQGHIFSRLLGPVLRQLPGDVLRFNSRVLIEKVQHLEEPPPTGFWSDYQNAFFGQSNSVAIPRFDRIAQLVRTLPVRSVAEIAGNQGAFAMLLLNSTGVKEVVCLDREPHAINQLYLRCRESGVPHSKLLQPVISDLMAPDWDCVTPHPAERFRSDLVSTLALTHHLTLTDHYDLTEVLRAIAAFTRRWAMVEFMPLGLWSKEHGAPALPPWYNLEWFRSHFEKIFQIIRVEEVETNRVLFFGELKNYR